MKLALPNEMKRIDQIAIEKFGIPGLLLMENAALSIAEKACEMLSYDNTKKIVAIAGKGNNGGDAFAAARHLHQWGFPVSVVSLVPRGCVSGDALIFLQILEGIGIEISYIDDESFVQEALLNLERPDLILDGIFGTGIHGAVTGVFAAAVEAINDSPAKVLSIDIPSGINGETGQICGVAVKADETVTFSAAKPGLFQYPGRLHAGAVTVAEIGIPTAATEMAGVKGELLDLPGVCGLLPERRTDGHKGTFGRALIITGSTGMTGAGTLCAKAAFKAGSGLVYLAVPKSLAGVYAVTIPEAIVVPQDDCDGVISGKNADELLKLSETMDAVVLGPGLSTAPQVAKWVNTFVKGCKIPMVLDADALNVLEPDTLRMKQVPAVVAPHPGEFARLTGNSVNDILADRVTWAVQFSQQNNTAVALKGAGTVVAFPDGQYRINTSGHSCLAVAGSGDVLAGIVGSLIGQGIPHEQALALAVFIHGRCGEVMADGKGLSGFTAGELCGAIPSVMAEIRLTAKQRTQSPCGRLLGRYPL